MELYEHNIPTYEELEKQMELHNKVALIQATGTGKSYIIGKYIEKHGFKNSLVMVPSIAIGSQWENLLGENNITIGTYQALAINGIDGDFDLVIADEMHHLGSDVWGKAFVDRFMSDDKQKVIGATATEIRYLDNSRDMAEELFNNTCVRGVDLAEAIDRGILPSFKYITSYFGTEDDYNAMREDCNAIPDEKKRKELSARLEMCIKNQASIKEAMLENLNMNNHKIIVFLNGICETEKAVEMFRDIFPECECHSVNNNQSEKVNKTEIKAYQDSTTHITILFAVDMLNEGVHIKGTDCVVMFRNTVSPQIYFQQLGRALDVSDKKPVVFDFACNYKQLKSVQSEENSIICTINREIKKKEKKIIVTHKEKEVCEVINLIKNALGNYFSNEECDIIRKFSQEKTINEIAEILGRPSRQVRLKAYQMGITCKRYYAHTDDEKIIELSSEHTTAEISRKIGRSRLYVEQRAKELGIKIKKRGFTEDEIEFLKEKAPTMKMCELQEKMGVSAQTIRNTLNKLGVQCKNSKKANADEMIRSNSHLTAKELSVLTGRTETYITKRARIIGVVIKKMNRTHLSDVEKQVIENELKNGNTIKGTAQKINRNEKTVAGYLKKKEKTG